MKIPVITRDKKNLSVRVIGQGQPVLLLHGLGMSSRHWLPFVLPYSRQFKFYMPDLRGAGHSAHIAFNQHDIIHNHMEDVQDIVQHFSLRNFCWWVIRWGQQRLYIGSVKQGFLR